MSDISKVMADAWKKINEGIGLAADSIANATKNKANEMGLYARRDELVESLAPKVLEVWKTGAQFPEAIETILKELTEVEEKIAALKPAETEKKGGQVKADISSEDEDNACEEKKESTAEEVETAEAPEAAEEKAPPVDAPVCEEACEETEEATKNEKEENAEETAEEDKAEEEPVKDPSPDEAAQYQTFRREVPVMDTPDEEETVHYGSADPTPVRERTAPALNLDEAMENVHSAVKEAAQKADDFLDDMLKKADASAEKMEKAVQSGQEELDQTLNQAADQLDKASRSAGTQVDQWMESLGKGVGKVVSGIGNFLEDLGKDMK